MKTPEFYLDEVANEAGFRSYDYMIDCFINGEPFATRTIIDNTIKEAMKRIAVGIKMEILQRLR